MIDYNNIVKEYCSDINTPAYIVDETLLKENLVKLKGIMDDTGAHILLAQKSYSMYKTYPLIGRYLSGTTASGLYEARLGYEEMPGREVHVYSPAYKECDMPEILNYADHIVFNSTSQWSRFRNMIYEYNALHEKKISPGLRINPEYAEIETDIYNPCISGSRLGTTLNNIDINELDGVEGIHFHTMCEQNSDVLERTIKVIDEKFCEILKKVKWINFGGGHHITKKDYDVDTLIRCIRYFEDRYGLRVYIEPGEAVTLNAGFLVATVLDIVNNGMNIAILDASAACHMPDVIEMPYRPEVIDSGLPGEKKYTYRFAGPTCLAGDVIGDYSFDRQLCTGDKVIFCDMAIYSMVKNNTFNGMPLPDILLYSKEEGITTINSFDYSDFKSRL